MHSRGKLVYRTRLLAFRQHSQVPVTVSAPTPDHYVLEFAAIGVPVKNKMPVHRIVARCIPSSNNRSYYHWQTAILTFYLSNDTKTGALNDFSRLLAQHRWTLVETLDRSTLIEDRVRGTSARVWDAYLHAQKRGYWMLIDPDYFASGKNGIPAIRPPRFAEEFVDRIVVRAGGRRLTSSERNHENTRNADYLIQDCVVELKDMQEEGMEKPERQKKLAELFLRYYPDETEILIEPAILSPEDVRLYIQIVGSPIRERIKDAAKQVKATKAHLSQSALRGGVIVLNSGYYSIEIEQFEKLVHHSIRNDTTQLDFAVCISGSVSTDGFSSDINFKFSPAEGGNTVQTKLGAAFGQIVDEYMDEWSQTGFAQPTNPAPLPSAIVFEYEKRIFRYFPPNLAPRWTPQSMGR